MTERTDVWRKVFTNLTDDGCYEINKVNIYQLTSHLEELYLCISELEDKVQTLEKDNELLKSYAWEQ